MSLFIKRQDKSVSGVGCRSAPANLDFQKIQIGGKEQWHTITERQSADGGSEKRKKKRFYGSAALMKKRLMKFALLTGKNLIPTDGFYTRLNDIGEYIAETTMQETPMEVNTVWDILNEIEDENLYRALLTVDKRALQIVLQKMQGYSLKETVPMVDLSAGAVYTRLDHLRKKLRKCL